LQLSKGTDIYTVSKMLGHRELKTTQIYAKIIDQTKREAADKIQLKQQRFTNELEKKQPNEIAEFLNFHLRYYKRNGGEIKDWVNNTQKLAPSTFNTYQLDAFHSWFENIEVPGLPQTDFNSNQDTKQKFIAEKLEGLRDKFNSDKDFNKAIELIDRFFKGQKINIKTPIFIKSGTIKNLAFCLGEIWRGEKNEVITYEYLKFYKQIFSVFKNQKIDPDNLFGCPLYKYSLSKT
jgi:predicted ATP-dependent Lon-type protease